MRTIGAKRIRGMEQDGLGEENRLEEEQSEHLWLRQIQDHDRQEAKVENYSWQAHRTCLSWSLLFQPNVIICAIAMIISFFYYDRDGDSHR